MKAKALELRDKATFIPLLAVDMNPTLDEGSACQRFQHYLLQRSGYPCDGKPNILITKLFGHGSKSSSDPHFWGTRSLRTAHHYITEYWDSIQSGDVIDVEFILGETDKPKQSERITAPL